MLYRWNLKSNISACWINGYWHQAVTTPCWIHWFPSWCYATFKWNAPESTIWVQFVQLKIIRGRPLCGKFCYVEWIYLMSLFNSTNRWLLLRVSDSKNAKWELIPLCCFILGLLLIVLLSRTFHILPLILFWVAHKLIQMSKTCTVTGVCTWKVCWRETTFAVPKKVYSWCDGAVGEVGKGSLIEQTNE